LHVELVSGHAHVGWEQRVLWWTLLVLAVALAYIRWTPAPACGEERVRYAGTVLQVLGVGTV
jgi:hypothetical protein